MKKSQILKLAWPVMISALLGTTLVTIDMFWIGQHSKFEIASVSIAGSIMGIIYHLSLIVSAGTLALISRFKGKDDPIGIENVIIHSFLASFILSGLLFVILYPLTSSIISVFKPEPALIAISSDYLSIMFIGLFFLIPFMVTNSMYPVKLNEYFACGLPVVTTAFQEAINIEGSHYVAHSYKDFADNVEFLSKNNNGEKYGKFAKNNDWQERFKIITDCIKSKKEKKNK